MKRLLGLCLLLACNEKRETAFRSSSQSLETYSAFDTSIHLVPSFDKIRFDTSNGWDFGWNLLEPINIATDQGDSEIKLSKRLSPGQKALYFIWYLDEEVTNGGFIQFYWNGYRKYILPIKNGLRLIGDDRMLSLVEKADQEYLAHKTDFERQMKIGNWSPLYENLKQFNEYDSIYYQIHDTTMQYIEKYARTYPQDFVKLK